MATKEDVQAFSEKYGSPLSGGVKIRTSEGEVETIPYSAATGAALRYNAPLYKSSSGEWSSTPEVRLYVDKENKRINLEAPASFYDRASFKQQFSENSILNNYAKNYNIDPNVTYVNEDDPDNPLTTEQLISKMDEDLQSYAKAVNNQEKLRLDLFKTGTGKIAQGLTEQDFAIMSTNGLGEEANGKSLIAIPKITGLNILDKIHGLEGYDKKNSVLTVDEFRNNVFNLSKMSGEELYQSYKALANYANYLNNLEDPTDEQVTEWARVTALLNYMGNAKVEGGTWEQAKLLANVIPSTGQAAVAAIGQTFTFIETISNAATYLLPMNWGREWEDTIGHRDIFYNATTQLNENLAQTQAQLDYLNNVIGGINTIGRVVGTGAAIYGEGMVGSALLEATTNYLVAQYGIGKTAAATATALGEDATAAAQGARAAFRSGVAGQLGVTETPSALVTASKSILALAKTDSTYLLNGTATLINTLGGAAQAGSQALDLIRNAAIAAKAAYIGGTIAGALSNIVIATVALNGTTFRDYIATGDPELGKELKDAIAWQAAMFTLSQVWNIGKGIYSASQAQQAATQEATRQTAASAIDLDDIAKASEAAAEEAFRSAQTTTVGSIAETSLAPANIALSKAIVGTQGRVGAVKESIKKAVLRNGNYIANIGSPNKRQAEESAAIIREAALAVGKADGVENTREALTQYVAVQEAEDLRTQGVNEALSLMTNEKIYPSIAKAQVEIVAAEQKLAKIEKMYNLPVRDQAGASTSLVQDNYAGALARVPVIENDIEITGKATEAQNTELGHWNQVIEDTETNYPELAAVVKNEYLPGIYRLNAAITELERVWRTQPEADLDFYQTSPLWKQGYAHMQRVSEATEAANQRRYLAILERRMPTTTPNQHYAYGSTEDFMNLYQAAQNRMIDIAIAANARRMTNTMTGYQGAKRVVKVNGQDYARTKTIMAINRQQDHVAAQTRKTIRNFAKGEEGLKLVPAVKEWANNILLKASQASSTRSAARANAKTIRVNDISDKATRLNPYKLTALQQLPDQNVATLANSTNGLTFQGITPDEFDEVIHGNSLDKKAKTAVRKVLAEAIGQNAQFIGWDNATGTVAGLPELSDLPKIKTSSFKKAVGAKTLKDIDPAFKPYLSEKNGYALEDIIWTEYFAANELAEGVEAQLLPDDIIDGYKQVIERATQQRELFALTYDNYTAAANLDSTLPRRLDETMLMNSAEYKNNSDVISAAKRLYISHQKFLAEGLLKDELGKLQEATKGLELSEQDLIARTNNLIDSFLGEVYADKATSDVLDALTVNEPDVEVAKEYVVLWELWQNTRELGEALESSIYSVVERDIAQYNASIAGTDKKLLDSHDIANRYTEMFKTTLYERRNIALNQLKEQGSPLVKTEDVYREIRDLQKEMTQASSLSTPNMLPVLSADGNTEILEVDPMVADLIQFRPTPESYTPFQKLMRNKAFEYSHRLFRLSTTGVNAGSLLNQFFRDPLSAWITAGTTQGPQAIYRNIMVNFGPQILDDFRTNEPTLFKHLEEVAKQRGVDINTQVKDYLAAQGEAIAAGGTETAVTRFAAQDSNIFDVTKAKAEKVIQIMETPNEWREQGLRKANYARGVQRAMRQGYNTQQAQLWGARTARDATTDFNRMTVHLQAFTNSIPYLRSAINAPKSFYRMLSLDPIGMALRLTTGIFIPMMVGIISVCRDPETKEQYKQLNEYEKDGVLIFNFGGSLQKIPIPQEAGRILSPIRSLIEKLADANDKDLSLLMANDMLGFSPMNWPQDILDVDHNILMDEATWGDRLMMGALGAFSEMSPLLVKSVFEAIYGVDPYTGEPIDKSYYTLDADDNRVLMDSETSEFARWLGSITGWAPSIIAAAVEDLVGQSATNLLNWLVSIGNYVNSGGEQGNPLSILDATAKQVAGKLTVAEYDRTAKRWRDAVSGLSQQKADLMEGYQKYTAQINAETNTAKRKELIAKRQDYVSEYINNVKSTVDTMIDELGGSIDSYRFATVVNLLNFDTATNVGTTEYSRTMGQELFYEGKEAAQRTIEMMGIRNTIYGGDYSGQSLLGYYYKDNKTGEVKYNFYTPLQILNAQNVYYNKQDLFTADIEAALKTAGITRSAMFEGYNDLTKAQKKQYKRDWNSKVIKTLWPYVEQYGANNIISNQEMVDLFSRYIFVDNPYTAKQYLIEVFGGATK